MSSKLSYSDSDLTFYLVVYKDFERACWCIANLRRVFPNARLVIDVDGDDDERWESFIDTANAEVMYGERLFQLEYGGQIVRRMLEWARDDPEERRWFFRIDTDTDIRRRFKYLPDADYFGHHYPYRDFIQGGCVGMTRDLCCKVLESGVLDREDLATDPLIWQDDPNTANGRVLLHGLVSFDWILHWAVHEVGYSGTDFLEVRSTWRKPIPTSVDCAVAHPCKHIPVNRRI